MSLATTWFDTEHTILGYSRPLL